MEVFIRGQFRRVLSTTDPGLQVEILDVVKHESVTYRTHTASHALNGWKARVSEPATITWDEAETLLYTNYWSIVPERLK